MTAGSSYSTQCHSSCTPRAQLSPYQSGTGVEVWVSDCAADTSGTGERRSGRGARRDNNDNAAPCSS